MTGETILMGEWIRYYLMDNPGCVIRRSDGLRIRCVGEIYQYNLPPCRGWIHVCHIDDAKLDQDFIHYVEERSHP
jgi:hypothetical protein